MKCKHGRKFLDNNYIKCAKDGSVRRKCLCNHKCFKFEPTLWSKLKFRFITGEHWRN